MAIGGTARYETHADLPPRVIAAVAAARDGGFATSCLPEQGRLLQLLAAGLGAGKIAETGTGYGVGLAWMASMAHPDARLFSIERDPHRARQARRVFADDHRVQIRCGDWRDLAREGPFDLLVLDGGGQGKADEAPLQPAAWLRPGALVVLDDFTPMTSWPPRHAGRLDEARRYWLEHPQLRSAEVRITPTAASLIATYIGQSRHHRSEPPRRTRTGPVW
jgi:predicted O-methyltransferase YrrM